MQPCDCDVLLVSMPWPELGLGSIQLGILKPILETEGISTGTRHLYLDWMDYLLQHNEGAEPITLEHYQQIATRCWTVGLGDWIFSGPPLTRSRDNVCDYFDYARGEGISERVLDVAKTMRALAGSFLDQCANEIIATGCRVVGFTTSFSQNTAALSLAFRLKQSDPTLAVMFGGANCDGPMGSAIHRCFPWVDVVIRGEAERVVSEVVKDLLSAAVVRPQPGLCYRADGVSLVIEQSPAQRPPMDEIPTPDYDEYFERLKRSPVYPQVFPNTRLLIESARGCWWGQKKHCTFCGLNGSSMTFESKSPEAMATQVEQLAARYQTLNFEAVDNIIDFNYFKSFLPRVKEMRQAGYDFSFFYETKANLTEEQVRLLRQAGVDRIQPGIESFSNSILRLMHKGTTGLQNIRLLRLAAKYGVTATWNIIYGFPGEVAEEYQRMADTVLGLTHLRPPGVVRLRVQRFSPYHRDPTSHNLRLKGPAPYYAFLYSLNERDLTDLAYEFEHEYCDNADPDSYVKPLKDAIAIWERSFDAGSSLQYERGPGFLRIKDQRRNLPNRSYFFDEVEGAIYLACESGKTKLSVWQSLKPDWQQAVSVDDIEAFLDELAGLRLIYKEDGCYLSLANPSRGTDWQK